jgi:hypothetical protein
MRQSLPKFNELVEDLDSVLQRLYKATGSKQVTRLEKHLVVDHGWGEAQIAAFAGTKRALANMITLAHPDPSKTFTLFPDASHRSWGFVLTQIEPASSDPPALGVPERRVLGCLPPVEHHGEGGLRYRCLLQAPGLPTPAPRRLYDLHGPPKPPAHLWSRTGAEATPVLGRQVGPLGHDP